MAGKKGALSTKPATVPRDGKPADDYLRLLDGRRTMPKLMRAQLQAIYDDLGGVDYGPRIGIKKIAIGGGGDLGPATRVVRKSIG